MNRNLLPLLFAGMLAGAAHAQTLPQGCGNDSVQFKVKTAKDQPPPTPDPAKAQIVFIAALDGVSGAPTSRFGVEGNWVGATHGASYTTYSVTPGTYHLCAARQSSIRAEKDNVGSLTVKADAGKVYFFEFRIKRVEVGTRERADGGAGNMLGGGSSNMTARDLPTVDEAAFAQLSETEGAARLKSLPVSTGVPK